MFEFIQLYYKYETLAMAGLLAFFMYTFTWMLSVPKRNVSLVDITWSVMYSLFAIVYFLGSPFKDVHRLIFSAIVFLHGARLGTHLFKRAFNGPEDARYKELFREKIGSQFWWLSYFIVFLPQLVLSFAMGLVFYEFNMNNNNVIVDNSIYHKYIGNFIANYVDIDKLSNDTVNTTFNGINSLLNNTFGGFYFFLIQKILGFDLAEKENFIKRTLHEFTDKLTDSGIKTNLLPEYNNLLFIIGIAHMIAGAVTAAIADYQLAKFKSDPANKSKIMSKGLFYYSRHPNLFGEFVFWLGCFV